MPRLRSSLLEDDRLLEGMDRSDLETWPLCCVISESSMRRCSLDKRVGSELVHAAPDISAPWVGVRAWGGSVHARLFMLRICSEEGRGRGIIFFLFLP